MNEQDSDRDFQWLLKMLALEEERGSIVPNGAVGGTVARAQRAAPGRASLSAAERARKSVRFLARAVPAAAPDEKAA